MKKFTALLLSGMISICPLTLNVPCIGSSITASYAADTSSGTYEGLTYIKYNDQIIISGPAGSVSGALKIPASIDGLPVTSINSKAFVGQTGITSVYIPASVQVIGDEAFNLCDIKPTEAFTYYPDRKQKFAQLSEIIVDPANPYYTSVDGVLFSKNLAALIQYPHAKEGAFTAPSDLKVIKAHAFDYCAVESVTLPEGITEIPDFGFMRCVYLTKINIPNTVTKIGQRAFQNTALESIVLPPSVETIGLNAFFCCIPLNTITVENPKCNIPGGKYTLCNNYEYTYSGTIIGYEGSLAQTFAKSNNCNFQSLGSAPDTPAPTTTSASTSPSSSIDTGLMPTETTAAEETVTTAEKITTTTEETTTTTTTTTGIPWWETSTTTTSYIQWWETSTSTESTTTTTTATTTQTTTTEPYVPETTTTKAPEKVTYYIKFVDEENHNTLSGVRYRVYSFDSKDEDYGEMISGSDAALFNFYSDSFDIEILGVPEEYTFDDSAPLTYLHSARTVEIGIKRAPVTETAAPETTTTTSTTGSTTTTTTTTTTTAATTTTTAEIPWWETSTTTTSYIQWWETSTTTETTATTTTTETTTTTAETTTTTTAEPYVPETTTAPVKTQVTYYIKFVDAETNDPISGIRYRVSSADSSDPDYGEKTSEEYQEAFAFLSNSFTIQLLYVPDEYSYETVDPLTYTDSKRIVTVKVKKKSELPPTPVSSLGDVNSDGLIDASDASLILAEYASRSTGGQSQLSAEQSANADLNRDGEVDASDASLILAYYAYKSTGGQDSIEQYLNQ